jgi:hypothetical protein
MGGVSGMEEEAEQQQQQRYPVLFLQWNEGHLWTWEIELPVGPHEFKVCVPYCSEHVEGGLPRCLS